ncbi:DNA polymerase [Desulfallas thermosapovorans DSM 6562]|uniref:Type-4 uracil-DNA glycosylase n=1 Tax=Desulfallas thermosapovorans DSM 6562 TaxID=1121431 RepID=A0A5S4ZRV5_9FIRM|nr:DNA polymerase [Desulfallas thermosapovorans DSM 6562]
MLSWTGRVAPAENEVNKGVACVNTKLERWNRVKEVCLRCSACPLAARRTNVVFGEGVLEAPVMFVGEGPGEQEDIQGRPFVGPAGQLLDRMLAAIGLDRKKNAIICNIVKCRPPGNRVPTPEEGEKCLPFLRAQVDIVRPRIIVCLGSTAVRHIIGPEARITRVRGQWEERKGFWITATYHPAALLRDTSRKAEAWSDMKSIRAKLVELGLVNHTL